MPPSAPSEPRYEASRGLWYLDGMTEEGHSVRRVPILALPFLVGRLPGRGLTLSSPMISGRHAEIFEEGGVLKLRDLGSTNGTSLNGERVEGSAELHDGDMLHFAKLEFRLGRVEGDASTLMLTETMAVDAELPEPLVARGMILRQMMRQRSVRAVFQPIVDLADGRLLGYESLGRGDYEGAPVGTSELFKAATVLGAEAELSRILRQESAASSRALPAGLTLFINTHPEEFGMSDLLRSLADFRRAVGNRRVVVEIHERAVTDPQMTRELGRELKALDLGLAYDDFGAGEARLVELTELPPDFLKFDLGMIRDLDSATPGRRKLTAGLVAMARELGIATVAEGIETAGGAAACRELGFDYAQGYYFGRPAPVEELVAG